MIRVLVILAACFGAFIALVRFFPSSTHTAFTISGTGVPWFALGVCALGFAAYKITK